MEGLAMLKQLIGQLQELLEHSPPTNTLQHFHHRDRSCFLNTGDDPADDYYSLVMAAGKSGSLKTLKPYKPPPQKKPRKERNRGKLLGTRTTDEVMEQQIWKEFPEDLFEAVVARLPVATFFRFRSVCQKWNSMLISQTFSQHCDRVTQPNPWFCTGTDEDVNSGVMYDPSSKKWRHPTVSYLPEKRIVLPVASAGGLVCFMDIGGMDFFICNPLTQTSRELPPSSARSWYRVSIGMTLNEKSTGGGYKILCVGCDGKYEVYDSTKNSWIHPGPMPSSIKLPLSLNLRSQAVSVGNTLYFTRSDPEGVLSYDTATGLWKQYSIPLPPHLTDYTLAACGGRVVLAGLVTKNAATCVCVWELQRMTLLWKEVDRMPNEWCLEFYGKHVTMTCLGNKKLLMLSLKSSTQISIHISRQTNRLVMYNIFTGEWLKVPGWAVGRGRKRQWMTCGAAFYPCLTVSV